MRKVFLKRKNNSIWSLIKWKFKNNPKACRKKGTKKEWNRKQVKKILIQPYQ